jgi:hypothetical protein
MFLQYFEAGGDQILNNRKKLFTTGFPVDRKGATSRILIEITFLQSHRHESALVDVEDLLAEADALGGNFDELVFVDEFERLLE